MQVRDELLLYVICQSPTIFRRCVLALGRRISPEMRRRATHHFTQIAFIYTPGYTMRIVSLAGRIHAANEPAVTRVWHNERRVDYMWYWLGRRHRSRLPAHVVLRAARARKMRWYRHGRRHRWFGPAVEASSGNKYYVYGVGYYPECLVFYTVYAVAVALYIWSIVHNRSYQFMF